MPVYVSCGCVCLCPCVYVFMYVCGHVCMCECMYVCMHKCIMIITMLTIKRIPEHISETFPPPHIYSSPRSKHTTT